MGALRNIWQRIGTKLYLALGFAVFLTLVSSAVGVYYFERSGDLNYQVRSESVPSKPHGQRRGKQSGCAP